MSMLNTRLTALATLFAVAGMVALPAWAGQPTLDELLELGSPDEQRDAVRDAAGQQREPDADDADDPDDAEAEDLDALDESLRRMLEGDRPADVFAQAVREMGEVSNRLGEALDAGVETQRAQQSILDKLDQVIAAAQQQQDGDASGDGGEPDPSAQEADSGADDPAQSQPEPSPDNGGAADQLAGDQPAGDEASPGEAQDADLDDRALRELRREWGNLPPRLRDEIAEGMNERYSPVYRALTEAYYRKLAEEQ